MKKYNISEEQIATFLENHGTFSHEMHVADTLKNLNFKFDYSGFYTDADSEKKREFDFVSTYELTDRRLFVLSIEAKAFAVNSILIANRIKRGSQRSFHCVFQKKIVLGKDRHIEIVRENSKYLADNHVAISIQKISKLSNGNLKYDGDNVHSRLEQALHVCRAIHLNKVNLKENLRSYENINIVYLPILVVPDDSLWAVDYDENFNRNKIAKVNNIEFWVDEKFNHKNESYNYCCSHIELVTLEGLKSLLEEVKEDEDNQFFPLEFMERFK